MVPEEKEYFKKLLDSQLAELMGKAENTITEMESSSLSFPDPGDRALQESSSIRDLRIRDRERKLITKIQEALDRIDDNSFGICDICEEPIGQKRLKARPVTALCLDCKESQEEMEKRNRE